jgi:hypothetical protein
MTREHEPHLALEDLCRVELLPPICARCGRAAVGTRSIRVIRPEEPRPTFLAALLWELGFWSWHDKEWYDNLAHEYQITRGRVKLPVCRWHRWLAPPAIGIRLVSKSRVALSGVSDEFIAALKKKGWVQ